MDGVVNLEADVNGDGVVNVFDLVFVAGRNAVTRASRGKIGNLMIANRIQQIYKVKLSTDFR